jgi:multiple sugar transport system substrate-binding protein
MKEIAFTTISLPSEMAGGLCKAFTSLEQVRVAVDQYGWSTAWNQLVQIGLSTHGPDVSEVGSTWLGSLYAMEALQPLNRGSISVLEWEKSFAPVAWNACLLRPRDLLVAIPWILDVRVVLYRRDWLQKAGVDESTAFEGIESFYDTLRKIKVAGHPGPLGLTNNSGARPIHDVASWVWDAGGHFRTIDGRSMTLKEPAGLRGLQAYFGLSEFIAPEMRGLNETEVESAFIAGKTAVTLLSERTYYAIVKNSIEGIAPEVAENIGMALLLKAPFVGGTCLVVWRHSPFVQDGLKLINYLTSMDAAQILYERSRYTPARVDALEHTSLASDPFYPVLLQSIKAGRSLQAGFRWGAVEARLLPVIEQFWQDLQADPGMDIHSEVEARFVPLCERLEGTILATYE